MAKTTFWDVIEKTIEKVGKPLSAREIWDKANEIGTTGDFESTGKTPWATIAAYCTIKTAKTNTIPLPQNNIVEKTNILPNID